MRSLADELAAAGKPLGDDELISYITAGLDMDYQPLVSALDARTRPVTLDELYAQMSNFDQRVALFQGTNSGGGGFKPSANAAMRGRGGGSRYRGPTRGKGNNNNTRGDLVIAATAATLAAMVAGPPTPTTGAADVTPPTSVPTPHVARSMVNLAIQRKTAGTGMMMTVTHPQMRRWLGLLMAHMEWTQTGMWTAAQPTTSPVNSRR